MTFISNPLEMTSLWILIDGSADLNASTSEAGLQSCPSESESDQLMYNLSYGFEISLYIATFSSVIFSSSR